jgi:hypothetical protein
MTHVQLAVAVAVGLVAALAIHELGHVLAAGALGGHGFRITRIWPAIRVEAELPPGRGAEVVFLLAGAIANLGAAGALVGVAPLQGADAPAMHRPEAAAFAVAAAAQVLVGLVALLPIGDSDGARLWRRLRGQGPVGM